ncbi:hypothetical protein LL972_21345 [Xanthomonas campestris pv. asclepiadis]|uniref:hypothetical protein n=1 Tax=Xanthomonas campestris TaxID=339 RepID=UPI001E597DCA|nr:hypothetical protein [Xanthomonas campestris]MCC4618493.1 hypothetical protein [Xanthomonas campestris pv. asclepiadis]
MDTNTNTADPRASRHEFQSLDDATHWLLLQGAPSANVHVDGQVWCLGRDGSAEPVQGRG